ncbi:MAG: hypothetical protein IIB00_04850 [candidate division Zixibacteria bacterium]|nr:hypothetical protein [candidate division Zixibacteria bacterium]
MSDGNSLVRVRYYLERGRTYQSSGEVEKSYELFSDAFAISEEMELDFYAIDAAHMFALAYTELSKDIWLARNESARLKRIKRLGEFGESTLGVNKESGN